MCGIVGVVSAEPVDSVLIEQMRDRLAHRGPDHAGLWRAENSQVCLGHRRLAIVDLQPESNQPFCSNDGRYLISFNGEIYNFQSLRQELSAYNVLFRTGSDTEVLIEAYRRWGSGCLERLAGMFAFAIWDKQEQTLFCARDRMGEKPFYYTVVGDSFIFASEVKSLLLWPGFRHSLDYTALIDYLTFGFVVDPKTIWQGCHKLPPGHSMTVVLPTGGQPYVSAPSAYWDFTFRPDSTVADWTPEILETLQRVSKEMAFADVPVGSFLSGGVDSSAVTAALSRAGCAVNAYTVGFEEQSFDERPWARQVAARYHTPFVERIVGAQDVSQVFEKMIWHYDEPFNDYSYLPTYYLCREARREITVALSGDGGDELFAGYRKYQRLGHRQALQRFVPQPIGQLIAAGANILPEVHPMRRTLLQYGLDARAILTDMLVLGFSHHKLATVARGPLAQALQHYSPLDVTLPLLQKAPPEKVGLLNAMRYLDVKLTLAGDILVKVDRASMAVALEVRPVYLHRDIVTLAERIPIHLLADKDYSKEALKVALRAWLPKPLLYRKKQGFAMPLQTWINGDLRHQFTQRNSGAPLQEILDTRRINELVDQHVTGKANRTACIHSIYFLQRWLSTWS